MRILIALDPRVEDGMIGGLLDAGHDIAGRAQAAAEIIAGAEANAIDVVLVQASRGRLTEAVIAASDSAGCRLVAIASGELERRYAAGLGLLEVVDESAGWDGVERILEISAGQRLLTRPGESKRAGRVIAVWGPAGAPGRTTVAINLAAELAAAGHSVVLADADSYGGSIAPALGMLDEAPGFAAACRLAASDSLTQNELERIADRYPSTPGAFRVLTGIGRPSRWTELSADRVTKTIRACTLWADFVVVDVGFSLESDEEISSDLFAPRRNAATLAALRAAHRVVAVGLADPVGLSRFVRSHVDLLEVIEATPCSVVINRVRGSAIGLNPHGQVAATLARFAGIHDATLLVEDRVALDTAVLTGRALRDSAPKSPVRTELIRLLETTIAPPPAAAFRPRRARRRRSAVPATT